MTQLNKEDLETYLGSQSQYYLDYYDQYQEGQKASFNFAAFLVAALWMMYRKMWIEILVFMGAAVSIDLIIEFLLDQFGMKPQLIEYISFGSNILLSLIFATYANYFYIKKAERDIRSVTRKTDNEDERIELLQQKGGTTWIPFIIILVGVLVVMMINNGWIPVP
jgi:hypothetical protein